MSGLSHKTILYGAAGALGGAAAWAPVLSLAAVLPVGLLTETLLGAAAGMFIGAFLWSHEALADRQFRVLLRRAVYGAAAGLIGGALGAGLGNTVFLAAGAYAVELGGVKASVGVALSVALGWALLGALIGMSGGVTARSLDRLTYGLAGGWLGGFIGGFLLNIISSTSAGSVLTGLTLLGLCIGAFISLVEEAFLSAKLRVIKGRHLGREFPLVRDENVIGRDDRSDVCLSGSEGVALQHAVVKRKKGRYTIEPDSKGKVVYVNHTVAGSTRLADGDIIRVGSNLLMFTAIRKTAAVLLLMLLLSGSGNPAFGQDLQVQITQFELSAFPEVKAYVSILNREQRPVSGLDKRILSVRENGAPVKIKDMRPAWAPGKREPLSLALVVDKSGSMEGNKITRARESVLRFISLLEQGDQASLYSFNEQVTSDVPLTESREALTRAVRDLMPGGHTALYDAIGKGVESVEGAGGRKAVIVLTDGKANRGSLGFDEAVRQAVNASVSVYVIGLGEDVRTARLERISQETGGSYFFTPSEDGLAEIYETISRRIRSEYVVTYDTEKRGEYVRTVSLSLRGGPGTERAYFQPRSSLFGIGTELRGWAFLATLLSLAGLAAVSYRTIEPNFDTGHLSVVRGAGTRKEIDVRNVVTIGRDERNTLGLFRDGAIEQRHAEIKKENGRYLIEDNTSAAGTFVNRERIAGRHELKDGDVIEIGGTRIVFSEGSANSCASCGNRVREKARFCPVCGVKAA